MLAADTDSENYYHNYLEIEYMSTINTITRPNNAGSGSCINNIFIKTK